MTAKDKTKDTLSSLQNESKSFFKELRGGRGVSIEFFRKNGWLLAILLVTILSLMGLRYRTQTRMVEIKRLKTQLEISESSKLREKQEYMTLIRQTKMNELVEQNHLNLHHQEQPPYEISNDGIITRGNSNQNTENEVADNETEQ